MKAVSQQATAVAAPDASDPLGATSNGVNLQSALYTLEEIVIVSKWDASFTPSFAAIRLLWPCLGAFEIIKCV